MPRTKSAIKRLKKDQKKRLRNMSVKSFLRTMTKKVLAAVNEGNVELAQSTLQKAVSAFQKAASKGIIHQNTASRKISRLYKKVNALVLKRG